VALVSGDTATDTRDRIFNGFTFATEGGVRINNASRNVPPKKRAFND